MLTHLRDTMATMLRHTRTLLTGSNSAGSAGHSQSNLLQSNTLQRGVGLDVYGGEDEKFQEYAITRYPPFDKGIPILPVTKILQSQQEIIDRIYRTAGVSKKDFERLYLPPIRNLANHVHLLPATSKTYFRGTGGLFRFSLEVALNTLQSANAAVFPVGGGVERRYFMMPRWSLASFIAGLCSQNYRTVNTMAVMTKDNVQWSPLISSLAQWSASQDIDVYFVRWMEGEQVRGAQAAAAYSISQIVPPDVLHFLAEDNNQIIPSMTAAIAGVETNISENPIGRLIGPVITRVVADDLERSATNYGHLVIGTHLEMHLVDAMRGLIRAGKWIANSVPSGGQVWVGKEGVFIDWQKGAADIIGQLSRNSFAGVPKDPETLAELLVSASLLEKNGLDKYYWSIALPGSFDVKDGMVKLKNGKVIFPQGYDFEPFQGIELILDTSKIKKVEQPVINDEAGSSSQNNQTQNRPATPPPSDATVGSIDSPGNEKSQPTAGMVTTVWRDIEADSGEAPANPDKGTAGVEETRGKKRTTKPAGTGQPKPASTTARTTRKKSSAAASGENDANGAPIEEAPADSALSSLSDDEINATSSKLLGSLKDSNAWLLAEVMKANESGTLEGTLAELPHGYGISQNELNRHGIPIMELLEELSAKAWLWQDKTKISRRIHPVELNGTIERMVILKKEIAAGLGFKVEGS